MTGTLLQAHDHSLELMTLSQLWAYAEKLGRVEVDHSALDYSIYRVEIYFKNKNGSRINAIGKHAEIHTALAQACLEAQNLGASS